MSPFSRKERRRGAAAGDAGEGGGASGGSTISSADDFGAFFRRHENSLLKFLARQVYDPETALEIASETFAEAFTGRHGFRGSSRAEEASWLETIARRRLSRYWRKGKTERALIERLGVRLEPPDRSELDRVEELAGLDQARGEIRLAMESLSEDHRQAIYLRVVKELDYPELAQQLGVSEQTARARVSRGLKALGRSVRLEPGGGN